MTPALPPVGSQAGGKDGIVAVWGSRELEAGQLPADEAVPPLLSHKLHKGWCALGRPTPVNLIGALGSRAAAVAPALPAVSRPEQGLQSCRPPAACCRVADVQFVRGTDSSSSVSSSTDGSSLLLLTAGNDGALCLWDLGRAAATGSGGRGGGLVPQCLARATDLHAGALGLGCSCQLPVPCVAPPLHACQLALQPNACLGAHPALPRAAAAPPPLGGIFSLAEHSGRVLTASKDSTVTISSLEGSGGTASLAAVQRYDELHDGVVKCARWRDAHTFASCGNDRRLCVVDARLPPSAGGLCQLC